MRKSKPQPEPSDRAKLAELARDQAAQQAAQQAATIEGLIRTSNPYDVPVGAQTAIPPGPWDRRPEESREAYQAFDIYRRLKPTTRSMPAVQDILAEKYDEFRKKESCKMHDPGSDDVSELQVQPKGSDDRQDEGESAEVGSPFSDVPSTLARASKNEYKRNAHGRIRHWCIQFDWVERSRAWDDYVYQQARENELAMQRQESIDSAEQKRAIRLMFLKIHVAMLQRILDAMMSGVPWSPKDLRDLTLAAERQGLVRDSAYAGVRDLLEDKEASQDALPVEVAARLHDAMMEIVGGGAPALPAPVPVQAEVIDVESRPA